MAKTLGKKASKGRILLEIIRQGFKTETDDPIFRNLRYGIRKVGVVNISNQTFYISQNAKGADYRIKENALEKLEEEVTSRGWNFQYVSFNPTRENLIRYGLA